jgi:diguanylate cyclase (GGDEF)-like protein
MRQDSAPALVAGSFPVSSARLHEAVSAALEAASLPDPTAAVDGVLAALHDGLDGAFVSLFLLEHDRLWLAGMRGYAMIPDGLALDEGIVGRAARTGVIQLVPDVTADADFVLSAKGVVSELAIPVPGERGVIGVLNVETTQALPLAAVPVVEPLQHALSGSVEGARIARTFDLSALARLFVYTGSLRDATAIAEVTARSLGRVIPLETCQLALHHEGGGLADLAVWQASSESPEPLSTTTLDALRARIDVAAVFELLDVGAMRIPELVGSSARSVALVPLRANGEEIGVLVGTSRFPRAYDHRQAEAAALLGAHAAASIDAALALSRERHSALTDVLTGLLNRRGFDETLERVLASAQDERSPLTVAVLDCDDFKDVNDRAGHDFGDALLREMGIVLDRITGGARTAARRGGDEFVVMLPGVDADDAHDAVATLVVELRAGLADAGFPVHLSGGLATYPYDGPGATQLLRAADQALYEAKGAGKAHIVAFRDVGRRAAHADAVAAERRPGNRPDASVLTDVLEAATAVWGASSGSDVLERLVKLLPFVLGAVGCVASRVDGQRIQEVASHSLRDIWLGDQVAYLLEEFPLTKIVVESGESRAISFLDEEVDRAEAFVLRELDMTCCLLVPIHVAGRPWGLVEVYDQRHRRFSQTEQAVADFLAAHAARRIELLADQEPGRRRLPLFRLPQP